MVDIFRALSEESRLRILSIIIDREMCVCDIETSLNMTQSNASRHLNVLKQSGILYSYKKAQWTYYKVNEKFKVEHKELFDYLCIILKELPTYQMDKEKIELCHGKNICALSFNPH